MNLRSFFKGIMWLMFFLLLGSCANPRWFWCSSNGIFTYNRHTGQLELIWENSARPSEAITDTAYVNAKSVNNQRGDAKE